MHFQGPVGFLRPSLIYGWKLDYLVLRLRVFGKRPKAVLADSFSESKAYIFSFRPRSSHFHADPSFWSAPPSNQLLKFKPCLSSVLHSHTLPSAQSSAPDVIAACCLGNMKNRKASGRCDAIALISFVTILTKH